jgi:hypothetical protein
MLAGSIAVGALEGGVLGHDGTDGDHSTKARGVELPCIGVDSSAPRSSDMAMLQMATRGHGNAGATVGWRLEVGAFEGEAPTQRNAQTTWYNKR